MILAALRRSLGSRARAWARSHGIALPEALPLSLPPAHVSADVSLPWAFQAAKAAGKNPLEAAASLAQALSGAGELEKAEPSPPGFVNLRLRHSALCANLKAITLSPSSYGQDEGPKRSLLIEFVSANPTGPLHLASGRAAALGDSLARILEKIGHKAEREYYVNDRGRQVTLLGESLIARRRGQTPPEGGYFGEYIAATARAPWLPESQQGQADSWSPEEFARQAIENYFLKSHRQDMEAFGVRFDRWVLESELHQRGALAAALRKLKDKGMVYEKDGATWLGTSGAERSEDDKDRVLVRADGQPTYFLADIAYHEDKYRRGHGELVDIWGADHHGYVPRMKAAIAALGHPPDSFRAIIHQLVHLFRGKEPVKMSKRAGEFVTLREVVEEVGKDACRFFFAMRTPDSHLNFDLELAKKRSSENPVYYCQYVHARICSIFREAAKQGLLTAELPLPGPDARLLHAPEERALLVKLAWFPETLKACERELSPHPLANYVLELSGLFHPFYEKRRVVDPSEEEISRARLLLCAGVRDVIKEGLSLLGVSAPEEM